LEPKKVKINKENDITISFSRLDKDSLSFLDRIVRSARVETDAFEIESEIGIRILADESTSSLQEFETLPSVLMRVLERIIYVNETIEFFPTSILSISDSSIVYRFFHQKWCFGKRLFIRS
jgi:hypothetical protein